MMTTYTEVYEQHDGWWIGQAKELPGAIVQERTLDEAKQSMREVIPLILEVQAEVEAQLKAKAEPVIPHAA